MSAIEEIIQTTLFCRGYRPTQFAVMMLARGIDSEVKNEVCIEAIKKRLECYPLKRSANV